MTLDSKTILETETRLIQYLTPNKSEMMMMVIPSFSQLKGGVNGRLTGWWAGIT